MVFAGQVELSHLVQCAGWKWTGEGHYAVGGDHAHEVTVRKHFDRNKESGLAGSPGRDMSKRHFRRDRVHIPSTRPAPWRVLTSSTPGCGVRPDVVATVNGGTRFLRDTSRGEGMVRVHLRGAVVVIGGARTHVVGGIRLHPGYQKLLSVPRSWPPAPWDMP